MPCDTKTKRNQTLAQRKAEVKTITDKLSALLASGKVRAKVGPQGAVAFEGWDEKDRDGVTDACGLRRILVSGTALARAQIARAEQLAGRSIDRQAVAQGTHSHDGGQTWHDHKG